MAWAVFPREAKAAPAPARRPWKRLERSSGDILPRSPSNAMAYPSSPRKRRWLAVNPFAASWIGCPPPRPAEGAWMDGSAARFLAAEAAPRTLPAPWTYGMAWDSNPPVAGVPVSAPAGAASPGAAAPASRPVPPPIEARPGAAPAASPVPPMDAPPKRPAPPSAAPPVAAALPRSASFSQSSITYPRRKSSFSSPDSA